ncbi:MAG TPA: integrase core domain-containing protein, partial [Haliangium sp.]|nr:integrase core domain-containing protein [Haliangium sp.]
MRLADDTGDLAFRELLRSAGVTPLRLPPSSPNLNAYAERFVRSIKGECLGKLVLLDENHLRTVVREYVAHYHTERSLLAAASVALGLPLVWWWISIGVTLENDDVSIVEQAIHGGAGQQWIAEDRGQFLESAVGRDQDGAALVAEPDDVVEIQRLLGCELAKAEIVQDQQRRAREPEQLAIVTAVATGGSELLEHVVRGDEQDLVAEPAGPLAQRLGDVALADA